MSKEFYCNCNIIYIIKNSTFFFAILFFILAPMKNTQLKWFSFVEILMIITILALISVVAYTSFGVRQDKAINTKVQSEVTSLANALLLAKQENNELPQPQWNRNFFAEDTSYVHNYEDDETFWVHGFITHNTLAKKYIDIVPVDPRTGSFYGYWKTKGSEMYEIAWVVWESDSPKTFVTWDYDAENGPFNLIREYNGPNFVHNESTLHFPYNPNERVLTATIDSYTWSLTINGDNTLSEEQVLNTVLKSWDTIEIDQNWIVELYYSDGSHSILWDTSRKSILTLQKLEYPQENNLITDIKLVLESGMIWNKAAHLDDESWFEIYTTDSTAAVRWTVFGVQKNESNSEIVVKKWKVAVNKNVVSSPETIKEFIRNDDVQSIPTVTMPLIPDLIEYDNWETYIEVIEDESEKWASVWTNTTSNTGSVDDIPDDAEDIIITNTPIINNNIKISLKDYSYSSTSGTISISLDMAKRVYRWADFLLINWDTIIFKENWWNDKYLSWDIITHTFNHNTTTTQTIIFQEDDIINSNNDESWIINDITAQDPANSLSESEELNIESELYQWNYESFDEAWWVEWNNIYTEERKIDAFNFINIPYANASWLSFTNYFIGQIQSWNNDFTLQIWKFTLNWDVRLTNKIKFTIVDEKSYESNENDDEIVDEEEIKKEREDKLVQDRWLENGCNGFEFTNINWEDKCADANNDLIDNGWELVAFAPYDNPGDLKMYNNWDPWNHINIHSEAWIIWHNCYPKLLDSSPTTYFESEECFLNPDPAMKWDSNPIAKNLLWFGWGLIYPEDYHLAFNSKFNFDVNNSFFNGLPVGFWNWEKGIILDNNWNFEYLKYSLDSNYQSSLPFIINMKVRWGSLMNTAGTYYLLSTSDQKIKLYLSWWDLKLKIDNALITYIPLSNLNNLIHDKFYDIYLVKDESWHYKIKVGPYTSTNVITNKNFIKFDNYFYMWSKKTDWKQWNDIIDYVKIYRK